MVMLYLKKNCILVLLLILLPGFAWDAVAQQAVVEGFVYEQPTGKSKNMPLPGATVVWSNSTNGTITDSRGFFSLKIEIDLPAMLVVSYVGYQSDTIRINKPGPITVALKSSVSLSTVNIEGRQDATMISTIKPINVEQIGKKELLKAACCNLSESFETNASVNVS